MPSPGYSLQMALRYVFVDEAGNFDFSVQGTRYFILTSITADSCEVGQDLAQLRRDLVRQGTELPEGFQATEDRQAVRDEVFRLLARHELRIDATIFEKAKTLPQLREDDLEFYRTALFHHLKFLLPQVVGPGDEVFVVSATLSLRRRRRFASEAIAEVIARAAGTIPFRVAAWTASSEPCLQVADYCSWAIQRKWERDDPRSHVLIQDKIASEFDFLYWESRRYY